MDQHNNQGFGQFYVEDYGAAAGTNETLQGHAHGEENFSNFTQANLWESTNPAFQPQYTTSGVNHGFTNDYANAGYEQQAAFQNQAPSQSPPQFQNSQYGGMFNDMGQPAQFHDYSNNFSAQPPQAQHPNPGHQTTISQVNPAGLSFVGQQQPSQQYQQSHPQQAGQPDQFLQHQFVAYEHGDHRMSHSIPQNQHGKMNAQPQIAPALQQPQGVPYDTYHQTSQPAQYSHQPDQGHFGAPFHSFGIQEARVQSSASPSNAQPLAPASNRAPQQASSLPPQQMAQAQGHPQQPLVSAQQAIGAASNGMPLQPSAKPSARAAQIIDGPPRVVEDLVKSRSGAQEDELFPGVPYLVVGSPRMAEPVKVPDMPMVQLDMSRNLGRAHLGQKQPLACELIKTYTDEATEHPENRDALKAQLIQQFKQQGKTVPWKAYGLKGWGQAGKDASPEADESDYESEVEEVRSATRPSDPVEAAAWDAIGIVYLDAEAAKDKKSVGAAVKAFGDFIKKIREDIKAEPETKDPNVLSPNQQRLLRAVEAAEEKGDDQVLVNLGGNNPLISNLVFSLHNLPKTADLSGELPKAVLRLLSRCSLHQDILEKVKFPRLEKRLMEKGDDEVKRLVKSVHKAVKRDDKTDMARSSSQQGATHPASKSSVASSDTSTENGTASKVARPASRIPSDTASSKRPREDEPDARASKKFAADPANGAAQAPSKASPTKNASTVTQHTVAPAKPWSGSALLPGKTRPAVKPAAKTDGLKTEKAEPSKTAAPKSGVLSKTDVSKLVATKRDPLKAEATKVKKPVVSRAEPSSSSKLGALLQEISMPKKQPAASTTPEAVPEKFETPEEKEKRLRKEKRRHLRVSWKEGDELTQVRVFQKDIEEDEGREDNMIRDARDDRSEGMVLKQSLKQGGMDVDDDEEDDDILYTPWVAPTPFDLSSLPAEKREKNYITRGGTLPIRTQQQKEMQDRENNVLMVVYTAASDIPPTPKSPAQSYNDPQQPKPPPGVHLPTNDPKYYEFHQRWTENQRLGSSWASHNALQRAESRQMGGAARGLGTGPQASAGHSGKTFFPWPSATRSEEVLSLLQSDRVKKWTTSKPYDPNNSRTIRRHDYPDPAVQAAADGVETVAAQLKGKPFPATEPPSYITDPARVKEWYEGYNREQERKQALHAPSAVPATASPADYAAMVEYYSKLGYAIPQPPTTQAQLPYDQGYATYYNQQAQAAQVSAAQQQAGGDANAQLQALMATLAGTGAQNAYAAPAALAPPQPDPSNDPQVQALLASLGSGVPQSQTQYPGQPAMPVPNTNDPAQQAYLAAFAHWAAGQHAAGTPTQQQAVAPPPDGPIPGQQQQQSKNFGNEYKQPREQPDSRDSGSGGRGQGQQGKHHAREAREAKQAREARDSQDPSIPSHLRGINRNLIGTKPCTFWRQNKCAKGDKCTFRHD